MTRFSWAQLDDGRWGVKASGDLDQATRHAGERVLVTRRDGSTSEVVLGGIVNRWNGGRAAIYTVAAKIR